MTVREEPRRRGADDDAFTLPIPLPRGPLMPPGLFPPQRPTRRRRWIAWVLVVALAALLVAGGAVATFTLLSPAATSPVAAAPVPAPAPAGPVLVDRDGQPLPPPAAQVVTGVYAALEAGDLAAVGRLYASTGTSWSSVSTRLRTPAQREPLLAALRTPPRRDDGYSYSGPGTGLDFGARGGGWVLRRVTVPAVPTTSSSPACPSASALVAQWARSTPYGAGARATGPVTCAGGFAVLRVTADDTPDGASTIFSIGPPLRYLKMGTGPICSDDPADGEVTVPRSAAAKLGCMTSGASTPAAAGPAPTLGAVWSGNQKGFGQARPSEINAGGDPTGVVENITWTSWGGATATGTGTGYWTPPDGFVSDSVAAPAKIVVSNLGTCHGHPAYLKVTWYYPTHGETAPNPGDGFSDICDGP